MSKSETEDLLKRMEAFHQQLILIVGFTGGIAFAGMVLVLGTPDFILKSSVSQIGDSKLYEQFVLGWLAVVTGFSTIIVVISLRALTIAFRSIGGKLRVLKLVNRLASLLFAVFIISPFILLSPVNLVLASVVIGLILFPIWVVANAVVRESRLME